WGDGQRSLRQHEVTKSTKLTKNERHKPLFLRFATLTRDWLFCGNVLCLPRLPESPRNAIQPQRHRDTELHRFDAAQTRRASRPAAQAGVEPISSVCRGLRRSLVYEI